MAQKTKIALIGGMSYHSTIDYYKIINDEVNKKYGGLNSAEFILHNVNFAPIEELMQKNDWNAILTIFIKIAQDLESIGATHLVMCTNTMHKLVPKIEKHVSIKFIHIADAVGQAIVKDKAKRVLLLGTKFTMQEDFYKQKLKENFGIEVITPNKKARERINRIIFKELCKGSLSPKSLSWICMEVCYLCSDEYRFKADGVILACTELKELEEDLNFGYGVSTWDTLEIHAKTIAEQV